MFIDWSPELKSPASAATGSAGWKSFFTDGHHFDNGFAMRTMGRAFTIKHLSRALCPECVLWSDLMVLSKLGGGDDGWYLLNFMIGILHTNQVKNMASAGQKYYLYGCNEVKVAWFVYTLWQV